MNLAKLRDGSAIQHGASGTSGMIIVGRVGIVVERPMAERSEQALDIALQVKERKWTRRRSRSESAHYVCIRGARRVPGHTHGDTLQLQRLSRRRCIGSRRFKHISSLEQANI